MLKRRGQAASWLLHITGELVLGLLLAALVAAGALAWRLAEGPIDLSFLAPRLSAALSGGPGGAVVHIRAASLAWEGFRKGIESPLDLVLADTVLTSRRRSGSIIIPRAELSLSAPALLLGRIAPRWIAIEAPRLHVVIGQPGGPALFFGGRGAPDRPSAATARLAGAVLDALNAPPGTDRRANGMRFPALSELRTLTIRDAEVTVVDPKLPATWFAPDANIRLRRSSQGGLFGHARMAVGLGGHALLVAVSGHLETHRRLRIAAHISAVRPKDLAALAPILRPLKAVDAPVSLELELALGANFALRSAHLSAEAKEGRLTFAGGNVPIAGGSLEIASAGKDALRVRKAVLDLAATQDKPGPVLRAAGSAFRDADGIWHGTLAFTADRVPMADLGRYWPPDIARGGRKWVTENITAGTAERARAALRFAFAPRFDRLVLEGAYGQAPASGLVVHWLRPIPPLTEGKATLSIEGLDALVIAVQHAREGRLEVSDGKVSITGLEEKDQNLAIAGRVEGPLQDALALLAQPRLGLLSRHKLPFSNAEGNADTSISVRLPLLANVTMDQVAVHANATLDQVRLGNISGTFGLATGAFTLTADNNEMNIKGAAALAGIPARLGYTMDFQAGPPASVNQRLLADATVTTSQLAGLHILDATSLIDGAVALSAELDIARDGAAKARIGAGLKEARLAIAPLGFVKPAGAPATAHAEIVFSRQKIKAINGFSLKGSGISIAGAASFTNGLPSFIRIDRAAIGRTEASGSVRFPKDGQPVAIALAGPVLDLSKHFVHPAPARKRAGATRKPAEKTLPWVLDARFGRTLLAHGHGLTDCALSVRSNGAMITEAHFKAYLGKSEPLSLSLASGAPGRTLSVTTADAGALLAALDITQRIEGGALTLSAQLDGTAATERLAGTARISGFRVKDAPVLGKVLQAMTLYGLADAMSGPGLAFSELVAPFRLANNILTLQAARAFSASLGLTADGTIDFGNDSTRLTGTVVPAYFFNSLLGRIPFIGRLFSPEKGSGLFAATYSVDGPLANPRVSVNPLAALTPGFLRGLFHIFD